MAKLGRPGLPGTQRPPSLGILETGTVVSEISRIVGMPPGSVFSILRPKSGIYFPEPTAGPNMLSLAEREEISRGLVAKKSIRTIATELGRAPTMMSREICKNKGPRKCRGGSVTPGLPG